MSRSSRLTDLREALFLGFFSTPMSSVVLAAELEPLESKAFKSDFGDVASEVVLGDEEWCRVSKLSRFLGILVLLEEELTGEGDRRLSAVDAEDSPFSEERGGRGILSERSEEEGVLSLGRRGAAPSDFFDGDFSGAPERGAVEDEVTEIPADALELRSVSEFSRLVEDRCFIARGPSDFVDVSLCSSLWGSRCVSL